ncbi:histone deacetylase family protein [Desulfonatronovibrio magnus]|uniref:histone deacetylase family protein n=1 Tax=Desulfonatronovibrio magnus TaxID=698827 RepID=UPI0005EAF545|nr:histone deacetylase [Desulfonatronovibrio magnus]
MSQTAIFYDPVFLTHSAGPGHPENADRLRAIMNTLKNHEHFSDLLYPVPRKALSEEIVYNHARPYVQLVQERIAGGYSSLGFPDTGVSSGSWDAALVATGSVLDAIDLVVGGECRNAFCAVRPPGHHARPNVGMGFCLFNNIAIGAWYAWEKYGMDRILIIDWDAHHGNGTQESFYEYKEVFFFSTHQSMWYPFTGNYNETGTGEGQGTTMNIPFPAGTDGSEVIAAFKDRLVPAMENYRPQLVLVSAGFDALRGDPLCRMALDVEDFSVLTRIALDIADQYAQGKVVSVLEGGYDLPGLTASCAAHVKELKGA